MLIEISENIFKKYFPSDPHPFLSSSFIKLNKKKVDKIVWLVEYIEKPEIGFVAGIKDDKLLSPFSAPFGGFHFKKENIYSHKVDSFISSLKEYFYSAGFDELKIVLPPDLYSQTFNAKCVSSFLRGGFDINIPEITGWVSLNDFTGKYKQKNSREYYRQAFRKGLVFEYSSDKEDKAVIYELIRENRAKFGRPIYMTLNDIYDTSNLWPVDFFKVSTSDGKIVASAIFYRYHPDIVFAVFWGDNDLGRPMRAMDFMILNLWLYYKEKGFKYIDLGISTEKGIPNSGLLRFKETHEALSSLRYTFSLKR